MAESPPQRLWLKSWNGPANHSDETFAVLAMPDDSVIVAGESYSPSDGGAHPTLLKFDAAGNLAWPLVESGFDRFRTLARSSTGDVLLAGFRHDGTQWNVFLRRVNAATGATVWQSATPATLSFPPFKPSIAEDPVTNGVLLACARSGDFLVRRYALDNGTFLGEFTHAGPQGQNDIATAVVPLARGGFVVAGTEGSSSGGYRVIAVDARNQILWDDHETGPIGNTFTPAWLGVDAQGNVLVGGGPETPCGLFQFRAWKLSPRGDRLWTVQWPPANPPCQSAEPAAFAISPNGAIAMVGQTHNPFNIGMLHVNPDGTFWSRSWNGPNGGTDDGIGVSFDPSGNVIVAGSVGVPGGSDIASIGFSETGDQIFFRSDSALPTGNDFVVGLSATNPYTYAIAATAFGSAENDNIIATLYRRERKSGDVNSDGFVNVVDLLAVISGWGPCPAPTPCPADVAPAPNGDGTVNVGDLLQVINNWGI